MSRIFECDYIYQLPDGTEWFRRRRYRLEPPAKGHTKVITYRWRKQVGHVWVPTKRQGADELIYHLPEVLGAKSRAETIWWPEGEKDADTLSTAGVVATTHHGGAGKITPEQVAWFKGHRGTVVLLYDVDPDDMRGGNPGAFDVVRRYDLLRSVGIARCQIRVGHSLAGKDVTDHLAAGHGLEKLVWLSSLTQLRSKAARTTGSSFSRLGYSPSARGDV